MPWSNGKRDELTLINSIEGNLNCDYYDIIYISYKL